ncbi:MAG: hypothetical protein MJ162_01155 [Treponema sp.]|nr:hypothetical protein [Treponema sp.]
MLLLKKYTEETVKGGGALKGANCTIKSIEAVPEGNKVTFEWTLTDGSKKTDFIIIKDGVDGKDGKDGIDGIDGEKGDKGDQGDKGIGIESITKKSSAGLVDTYLIVFTDGTESSFDVVNGANITKTSQLENDSNFITNIVNNLLNYYTKDEVYTKANIDELLRNIGAGLSVRIVAALPTEEISGTTIYLIKTSGNNYNQYMWIDNAWANLGSTTVDLSNYYTKDKVDEILLGYVTKDELASVLIDYVKKSELAKVATSNDYNDLDNLPEIPDVSGIKPYTNVLQDSENTAPTSKALYDAVSGINSEVEKKADSDDVPTKVTDLEDAEDYAKSSDVGNISELKTTDKSSAVAAINEINDSLVDIENDIGDLSKLETEAKTDLVSAINEAKESGGGGGSDEYSTEEVKTNKVWIDGNPIYRKIVVADRSVGSSAWGVVCANKLLFVKQLISVGQTRGSYFINCLAQVTADGNVSTYSLAGTAINDKFILEYTKTTD